MYLRRRSQAQISVPKGRVVVEPKKRPRYTLAELLADTRKPVLYNRRRDRAWVCGGPIGKEGL